MQHVDLIVAALALGAIGEQRESTDHEIINIYRQMKARINQHYPGTSTGLHQLEDAPTSKGAQLVVKDDLTNRGVGSDEKLEDLASYLLELVSQKNPLLMRDLGIKV